MVDGAHECLPLKYRVKWYLIALSLGIPVMVVLQILMELLFPGRDRLISFVTGGFNALWVFMAYSWVKKNLPVRYLTGLKRQAAALRAAIITPISRTAFRDMCPEDGDLQWLLRHDRLSLADQPRAAKLIRIETEIRRFEEVTYRSADDEAADRNTA